MFENNRELNPEELSKWLIQEQLRAHEHTQVEKLQPPDNPFAGPRHNPDYIRNDVRWFDSEQQRWAGEK